MYNDFVQFDQKHIEKYVKERQKHEKLQCYGSLSYARSINNNKRNLEKFKEF